MAKVILTSKSSAMKSYLPLLTIALALASCSTAYKSGQTPDDVYYSPARQRDEYVRVKEKDDRMYQGDDERSREERYLRMRARDRRYELLDDDYNYYSYNVNNYYGYNNYCHYYPYMGYNRIYWNVNPFYYDVYYNPYYYNSYYYYNPYYKNPYYSGGVVYGSVSPVYNKPRGANLHAYDRDNNYNSNMPKSNGRTFDNGNSSSYDNYRGSGNNAGGFLRNVFGSGSNNNSGSSSTTTSSSSSSSGSSSSSSSGSGHTPRKF